MNKKDLLKKAARAAEPAMRMMPGKKDLRVAAMMKAARWASDRVTGRRRSRKKEYALKGLAAAAVAIPLGIWAGSRLRGGREEY